MKHLLLTLAGLAMVCGTANAGRNANGAMVVHVYSGDLSYTQTYNFCTDPEFDLPASCLELVTQADEAWDEISIVWLVAAFSPESDPGVTTLQFGIRHNLPSNGGYFLAYGPCGPDPIQLPDSGWPEPNDCGNLVAYSTAVYERLFKFYWFAAYHENENSFLGTRTYPSTNEAKFVDDGSLPIEDLCYQFGTMRWGSTGENTCPEGHGGACCLTDGTCEEVAFPGDCEALGGVWYGEGTPCEPNPCPPPTMACCFEDCRCEMLTEAECAEQDGMPMGPGITCDPNPCDCPPPMGACCIGDQGDCQTLTWTECAAQGGEFMGDYTTCDPNPCTVNPTMNTTWGQIRARFR